jgi:hypothetical protein
MESYSGDQPSVNTVLTKDQQMFIYRWYPIMGGIYCSKELGVKQSVVRFFASSVGIPSLKPDYEYTTKEIAEILGMTNIEVQTIFNSAMNKLRKELKRKLDEKSSI